MSVCACTLLPLGYSEQRAAEPRFQTVIKTQLILTHAGDNLNTLPACVSHKNANFSDHSKSSILSLLTNIFFIQ